MSLKNFMRGDFLKQGRKSKLKNQNSGIDVRRKAIYHSPFIPTFVEKDTTMSHNLLKGKKGIITGALDESSIAWKVAMKCFEEGAAITLTNAPVAMRMGKINELAKAVNAEVVPADATSSDDLKKL